MIFTRILITGGAGFVGSSLAVRLRQEFPDVSVAALDNLHRLGSELNLPRLQKAGVTFIHGDVRCVEDLEDLPEFDLLIDCAAEPSVLAGTADSPRSVLSSNLWGTLQCLELAWRRGAAFLFLSTSRVYPIDALNALPWCEEPTRFRWQPGTPLDGFSERGIAESFPLAGARSFYGVSKLAAELVLLEYVRGKGMKGIIDRCGNIAGPWQMGKVDQGVATLWVAHHYFGKPLKYTGFGGTGKQVRDLLHVEDLFELLVRQMGHSEYWDGRAYNVGGGPERSVSLQELTQLCRDATGRRCQIASVPSTAGTDVRIFVADSSKARADFGWSPTRGPAEIVEDIRAWIESSRGMVERVLGRGAAA